MTAVIFARLIPNTYSSMVLYHLQDTSCSRCANLFLNRQIVNILGSVTQTAELKTLCRYLCRCMEELFKPGRSFLSAACAHLRDPLPLCSHFLPPSASCSLPSFLGHVPHCFLHLCLAVFLPLPGIVSPSPSPHPFATWLKGSLSWKIPAFLGNFLVSASFTICLTG